MIKAGVPSYLKKENGGGGESRRSKIARFRLGSEVRKSRYWEEEERRMCRLCGGARELWEYVWEECRGWKRGGRSWQEAVGWARKESERSG